MAENPRDIAEYQSDHDLLIELRTEMRGLRGDIKGLKSDHADALSDHETRLRALERRVWIASGGASIIGIIGAWVISLLHL